MISFDSCMLFSGWWQSATHVIFSTWFVAVTVMYRKKKRKNSPQRNKAPDPCSTNSETISPPPRTSENRSK